MTDFAKIVIIDFKKDFVSDSIAMKIVEVKDEEFDEEKLNTYIDKRIEDDDAETTRHIS